MPALAPACAGNQTGESELNLTVLTHDEWGSQGPTVDFQSMSKETFSHIYMGCHGGSNKSVYQARDVMLDTHKNLS